MIEQIEGRPEGTLEYRCTGRITGEDYEKVLIPGVERALAEHDQIRLLCQIGPDFEIFQLDAAWDDAKLGLRHWNAFERMAVVTDVAWIRGTIRAMGFALPCPIQIFDLDELDEARRWLQESLGAIHLAFEDGSRLVRAQLLGSLEPSAYRDVNEEIDAFVARHTPFRLLLDLREFDGWEGIAGLREHLSLVRDHRRSLERAAIVGNRRWERLAARIIPRVVGVEARFFEASKYSDAEKWVTAGA
jgi:hypothetical protein